MDDETIDALEDIHQDCPLFTSSNYRVPNCCAECLTTETSGCWRKGWEIDEGLANLCNRCGLRFKRQPKGAYKQALVPAGLPEVKPKRKKRSQRASEGVSRGEAEAPAIAPTGLPPIQTGEGPITSGILGQQPSSSLTAQLDSDSLQTAANVGHTAVPSAYAHQTCEGQHLEGDPPGFLQLLTSSDQNKWHLTAGSETVLDAQGSAAMTMEAFQPGEATAEFFHNKATLQLALRPWSRWQPGLLYDSWQMDRRSAGKASVLLFWVLSASRPLQPPSLAVVGLDSRNTGHFVYSSQPEFKGLQPFTCSNRAEVISILASIGACRPAVNSPIVPAIPSSILNGPISSKRQPSRTKHHGEYPAPDRSMQEAAEAAAEHDPAQPSALPDPYSRSQSRADSSFLGPRAQIELPGLDSGNAHMYAHPDSDVLQPSSGSQQIIPALSNWQDQPNFVSYREASGHLANGDFTRSFHLQDHLGNEYLAAASEPSTSRDGRYQYRVTPEFGGGVIQNDDEMLSWLQQATHASRSSSAQPFNPHETLRQENVQPAAIRIDTGFLSHTSNDHSPEAAAQHADESEHQLQQEQTGAKRPRRTNPTRAAAACNVCGSLTHGSWACPFAADAVLDDPVEDAPSSPELVATNSPARRHRTAKRSAIQRGASPANAHQPRPSITDQTPADMAAASTVNGGTYPPELEVFFKSQPHLWQWVNDAPSAAGVRLFIEWTQELQTAADHMHSLDQRLAASVHDLLEHLDKQRVNLKLLEASRIVFPMIKLRNCPDHAISDTADQLARRWCETAADALALATEALKQHSAAR